MRVKLETLETVGYDIKCVRTYYQNSNILDDFKKSKNIAMWYILSSLNSKFQEE